MQPKYFFRLDDACPTMDWEKWERIFKIFKKFNIKPIIAVIPNNEDSLNIVAPLCNNFWERVKEWEKKGCLIALHGYNHVYTTKNKGLVSLNKFSEFAGLDFESQKNKIQKAVQLFNDNGLNPQIWVAPGHSFDKNTLKALKLYTKIDVISDGFSVLPYTGRGFFWLPLQLWEVVEQKKGIWTVCYHPNTMHEKQFDKLERFLEKNSRQCTTSFKDVYIKYRGRRRSLLDLIFGSKIFFKNHIKSLLKFSKFGFYK